MITFQDWGNKHVSVLKGKSQSVMKLMKNNEKNDEEISSGGLETPWGWNQDLWLEFVFRRIDMSSSEVEERIVKE